MAYILAEVDKQTNNTENFFKCDAYSDLATITDYNMGDFAYIIATKEIYMANSSKEWVKQ